MEERAIIDAVAVYRGKYLPKQESSISTNTKLLPNIQEKPVFVPEVEVGHLLLDHYENKGDDYTDTHPSLDVQHTEAQSEPVSLVVPPPAFTIKRIEEPPHNLPVKPYEQTAHVWSFARFKSIFFGDSVASDETIVEEHHEEAKKIIPLPVVEQKKPVVAVIQSHDSSHVIEMKSTPLSRDEYRLVLLASMMLLAILLLLGYMYGHGRI